jgi:nitrogen fixation protein NifU and related proteins
MSLEELYQEIILDHYKKPRNAGRLAAATVEVHHTNPVCGDELTCGVALEGDQLAQVAVDGHGCSISQASASVMTEQVKGRSVSEALDQIEQFRRLMHSEAEPDEDVLGDGVAFAGVARYPARVKCALLGWMALKDAVLRAQAGQGDGVTVFGDASDEQLQRAHEQAPGAAPEGTGG